MSTPAVEVRSFQVTVPAGTALAAPLVTPITIPARTVIGVHWTVPSGPSGLMGWRLSMSGGQAVIPTGGGWIITDGDSDTWWLANQPDSGAWEVTQYNTDIYPHSVYLDFLLDTIGVTPAPGQMLDSAAISQTVPAAVTVPGPVSVPAITAPPPVTITSITTPAALTTALGLAGGGYG